MNKLLENLNKWLTIGSLRITYTADVKKENEQIKTGQLLLLK